MAATEIALAPATEADLPALEAYLASRSDTCMLLRANLRSVGLAWRAPAGEPLQAQYVIASRGDTVVGVAGHCWNGMLLIQAERHAGALAVEAARRSGRSVAGLLGDAAQVADARAALALARPVAMDSDETLMSLPLEQLIVPPALADGALTARRAGARDRELLIAWRIAYGVETGLFPSAIEAGPRAVDAIDHMLAAAERRVWLVERAGSPVAMCTHNAALPDSVQVGGVFTPLPLRGCGHARAVVAASLLDARAAGATRAILFTPRPDAVAAYRAVGFKAIGRYAVVVFAA